MRNLTDSEKGILQRHCLYCDGEDFYIGPQGGLSFNIYCANPGCHAGYNVTHKMLPWQVITKPGERELEELRPILQSPRATTAIAIHATLSAAIEKALKAAWPEPH